MKFLSILAAASLALAPAFASAGTTEVTESADNGRPISGPLAGRVLDGSSVPMGAIAVGGLVIIGGAITCILACGGGTDSNNNTND